MARASGLGLLPAQIGVVREHGHCLGERGGVLGRHEGSGAALVQELAQGRKVAGHDGNAQCAAHCRAAVAFLWSPAGRGR